MLIRELTADHVYLACGHTDMRKSIDGLASIVQSRFRLDPHQPALFLFCGRRKDRIKGLLWDETCFLLLYKRLENGHYRWPDKPEDLLEISSQQLRWLTEGLSISQPGAVQKVHPVHSF
jgi:transposase